MNSNFSKDTQADSMFAYSPLGVTPGGVVAFGIDLQEGTNFVNPPRIRWLQGLTERGSLYEILSGGFHEMRVAGRGAAPASTDPILDSTRGARSNYLFSANHTFFNADSNADLALNGLATDIPGATVSFTVLGNQATAKVISTFDFDRGVIDSVCVGTTLFNGAAAVEQALFGGNANHSRATVTQAYFTGLSAGAWTIKLQGRDTGGAAISTARQIHTRLSVELFDFA